MSDNDNVIQARFRQPTSLEEYIDFMKEVDPDDFLTILMKDGDTVWLTNGDMTEEAIAAINLHIPLVQRYLVDLYYGEVGDD